MKRYTLSVVLAILIVSVAVADDKDELIKKLQQQAVADQATIKMLRAELADAKEKIKQLESPVAVSQPLKQASSQPATWPDEWVTSFLLARFYRHKTLSEIDDQMKDIQRQISSRTQNDPHRKSLNESLAKARTEHKEASSKNGILPHITHAKIGLAGPLQFGKIKIIQVVGESEFRGQFVKEWHPRETWEIAMRFKGINTSGYADDTIISNHDWFIITGTQKYPTTSGSERTEFIIEPLDKQKWNEAYDAWLQVHGEKVDKEIATKDQAKQQADKAQPTGRTGTGPRPR